MTVKEALAMLGSPNEVNISWSGDLVRFNFRNEIEVDVWGGFEVGRIHAVKEDTFELVLAAQPIKREVTA